MKNIESNPSSKKVHTINLSSKKSTSNGEEELNFGIQTQDDLEFNKAIPKKLQHLEASIERTHVRIRANETSFGQKVQS